MAWRDILLEKCSHVSSQGQKIVRRLRYAGVGWTFSARVLPYPVPLWMNCSWGMAILVATFVLFNAVFFIGSMERLLKEEDMGLRLIGVTFGRLAQINVALLFLPVTQNSLIALLSGSSFERILRLHRWLGRWVFFVVHLHLFFLFLGWCLSGDFWGDLVENLFKDWHVIMGELAYLCLLAIAVTSFFLVRRKLFNLFYTAHVVLFPVFLIFLFLHFEPLLLLYYLIIPGILYLADVVIRVASFCLNHGTIVSTKVIGNDTVEVVCETWRRVPCGAGQYMFMCIPRFSIESHPFSVLAYIPGRSLDDHDKGVPLVTIGGEGEEVSGDATMFSTNTSNRDRIAFIVKANGNYTRRLVEKADTLVGKKVYLNGPYGRPSLAVEDYDHVLCIAGGVGITAILPFAESALAQGSSAAQHVKLVWSSRSPELLSHLEDRIGQLKSSGCECVIRCTTNSSVVELADSEQEKCLETGRIDLDSAFEDCRDIALSAKASLFPRVAVFCCGPEALSLAVTNSCRKYSSMHISFHLHDETFYL